MIGNSALANLDLLAVGVAVAAILVLGFVIFLTNRRSSTNIAFFAFSILTVLYGATNYMSYQPQSFMAVLWLLRLTIFLAVWHAFSIFHFFYVFPATTVKLSKKYRFGLIPIVALTSVANLTPFVFSGVEKLSGSGEVSRAMQGPLIPLFGIVTALLVIGAIVLLLKKTIKSQKEDRRQYWSILLGTAITFSLLITFNLILPVVYDVIKYIPLAPLFILPFIALTAYSIMRYHLLSVKIITTQVMTFLLAVVMLLEVVLTRDVLFLIFRGGVFVLVLSFGILLMRSVQREVEQRQEMERLTVQLKEANVKLEDLSRFKSQLLSLASHQIKSPLAAIKGFASILLEGLYGPVDGKIRETLEKMKKSTNQLVELINTLLDVRKVEEGRMDYQFAKTDLVKLIRGTMEELEPLATEKNIEFGFTTSVPELWISADAQKLKQVLQNIIDNSIKYTPTGFVKVALREESGAALFSVSDSGLGISQGLIPHLFEEFIREERVRKEVLGTGLGLYIAKKIVEAHNGRIWVESKGANRGAEFYVTLKKLPA